MNARPYPGHMAANPVGVNPDLRSAIERARRAFLADGSLDRPKAAPPLPAMPDEVRGAIERLIADGTYAAAVAEVVAEDPELGDL
jgi:hypothetical protein